MLAHPGLRRLHRRGSVRRAGVAVPSTRRSPGLTVGMGQGRRCNGCEIIEVKVKITMMENHRRKSGKMFLGNEATGVRMIRTQY